MKTYVVKDTIINLETEERQVFYTGVDGYVHDDSTLALCDGYKNRKNAEKKINREVNYYTKIDDNHCIESGKWFHHYEIVEVEK